MKWQSVISYRKEEALKDYIFSVALGFGDFYQFVKKVENLKKRFSVLQFIFITFILYLPLFYSIIKIDPNELYSRLYSISFDTDLKLDDLGVELLNYEEYTVVPTDLIPGILVKNELSEEELNSLESDALEAHEIWFCFTKEYIIILANNNRLAISSDAFSIDRIMSNTIGTLFNDVAVNNQYYTSLLMPVLLMLFIVLIVLQLFFYIMLTVLLGTYRMNSKKFSFLLRFKLLLIASSAPALISTLIGFVIPALHIIIFELVVIMFVMFISRKYDKKEKELFLCED